MSKSKKPGKRELARIEREQNALTLRNQRIEDGTDAIHGHITMLNRVAEDRLRIWYCLGNGLRAMKDLQGHGSWSTWVKENLPFTARTASRYITLYEVSSLRGIDYKERCIPGDHVIDGLSIDQMIRLLKTGSPNVDKRLEKAQNTNDTPVLDDRTEALLVEHAPELESNTDDQYLFAHNEDDDTSHIAAPETHDDSSQSSGSTLMDWRPNKDGPVEVMNWADSTREYLERLHREVPQYNADQLSVLKDTLQPMIEIVAALAAELKLEPYIDGPDQ